MTSYPLFSRSLKVVVHSPVLWLLALGFLLISCTAAPPAPETEEASLAQTTPENAIIYLPLFQKNGDPFPLPTEAPLTEWSVGNQVVPIMPGAQAGGEMDGNYVFTTLADIPTIETYYTQELQTRGWEALSLAEGPDTKVLMYKLGDANVTIKMDFLPDLNLSYVVIEG